MIAGKRPCFVMLLLMMGACATDPVQPLAIERGLEIQVGKTSRDEVIARLGEPLASYGNRAMFFYPNTRLKDSVLYVVPGKQGFSPYAAEVNQTGLFVNFDGSGGVTGIENIPDDRAGVDDPHRYCLASGRCVSPSLFALYDTPDANAAAQRMLPDAKTCSFYFVPSWEARNKLTLAQWKQIFINGKWLPPVPKDGFYHLQLTPGRQRIYYRSSYVDPMSPRPLYGLRRLISQPKSDDTALEFDCSAGDIRAVTITSGFLKKVKFEAFDLKAAQTEIQKRRLLAATPDETDPTGRKLWVVTRTRDQITSPADLADLKMRVFVVTPRSFNGHFGLMVVAKEYVLKRKITGFYRAKEPIGDHIREIFILKRATAILMYGRKPSVVPEGFSIVDAEAFSIPSS